MPVVVVTGWAVSVSQVSLAVFGSIVLKEDEGWACSLALCIQPLQMQWMFQWMFQYLAAICNVHIRKEPSHLLVSALTMWLYQYEIPNLIRRYIWVSVQASDATSLLFLPFSLLCWAQEITQWGSQRNKELRSVENKWNCTWEYQSNPNRACPGVVAGIQYYVL